MKSPMIRMLIAATLLVSLTGCDVLGFRSVSDATEINWASCSLHDRRQFQDAWRHEFRCQNALLLVDVSSSSYNGNEGFLERIHLDEVEIRRDPIKTAVNAGDWTKPDETLAVYKSLSEVAGYNGVEYRLGSEISDDTFGWGAMAVRHQDKELNQVVCISRTKTNDLCMSAIEELLDYETPLDDQITM